MDVISIHCKNIKEVTSSGLIYMDERENEKYIDFIECLRILSVEKIYFK
jgi:hypothetical protein